jgi:hypothetical protein
LNKKSKSHAAKSTYNQLLAVDSVAVVRTVVQECTTVREPSVHIHQLVDQYVHVRVSMLFDTVIVSELVAIVADLAKVEITKRGSFN